jgi:hypothetical protein
MAYVMMAVPAELVAAVTEFIEAQGMAGTHTPAVVEDGFVHGWDRDSVWRAYKESADKMRDLLDFLAENPGREVSSEEIAEAIDAKYGWNTIAGMLGAFGRRCTNRYRKLEPMWEYRPDENDRNLITLPPKTAEVIRDARES